MEKTSKVYKILKYLAIFGNIIYILWILYNGINEGFSGKIVEIVSCAGLVLLLIINIALIYHQKNI